MKQKQSNGRIAQDKRKDESEEKSLKRIEMKNKANAEAAIKAKLNTHSFS